MIMYSNRIECIDTRENRVAAANELFDELVGKGLVEDRCKIRDYFVKFIVVNLSLSDIIEVAPCDIIIKVYEKIASDFIEEHINLDDFDFDHVMAFFQGKNFNEVFEMVFDNTEDTENELNDYLGINDDEEETYDFHTNVEFEIHCEKNDDPNWVENELNARIGRHAAYKWRAAKIVGLCAVYQTNRYVGIVNLVINGNDTYTADTIETAIHNRLGANAKRLPWAEFVINNIDTDRF